MNIEVFKAFRHLVNEQGLLFYYNGVMSQTIVAAMGEALRGKLSDEAHESRSAKATRRVFSTFVEMTQNILHYAENQAEADLPSAGNLPIGNVAVGRDGERYYIVSGNLVIAAHTERLKLRLDALRAMSQEEIRAEYKRQLRNEAPDALSKGAGLGFLTVARDASQPIEYLFEPFPGTSNTLSFFYLKAII